MAMYTVNKPKGSKFRDDNLICWLCIFKYSIKNSSTNGMVSRKSLRTMSFKTKNRYISMAQILLEMSENSEQVWIIISKFAY